MRKISPVVLAVVGLSLRGGSVPREPRLVVSTLPTVATSPVAQGSSLAVAEVPSLRSQPPTRLVPLRTRDPATRLALLDSSPDPLPKLPPITPRCGGLATPKRVSVPRADCGPTNGPERIHVVHVSDMHGHWHPSLGGGVNGRSPFSLLKAHVERRRIETGGRTVFVDAGDDFEKGSLAELRSGGEATRHLIDHLGLDIRTLGNHDFAYSVQSVLQQAASPYHTVLASNITYLPAPGVDADSVFRAKRTAIVEIGCVRIGFFGLVTNGYDETDERVDAPYLGVFAQHHDVASPTEPDRYTLLARTLVSELRDRDKADVVIAVNHLGFAKDRALLDIPGLDLVVGGHDHVNLQGWAAGKHGVLVDLGSFLGRSSEARVGEVILEVDKTTHTAKPISITSQPVEDLREVDMTMDAEVAKLLTCYAPEWNVPISDLLQPLGTAWPEQWTPLFDEALSTTFPGAEAYLYEGWSSGGIVKGELSRGPVTPQELLDFTYVEKQRSGGPGFTAMERVEVSGDQLRGICDAVLREPVGQRMHRVCPSKIEATERYSLIVERRTLFAPHLAFAKVPANFPLPTATTGERLEAYEVLLAHAKRRRDQCLALDLSIPVPCRGEARPKQK